MNVLIISALLGVLMMFSSVLFKSKYHMRVLAIVGMIGLIVVNALEINGTKIFSVNTTGMMAFDRFALVFMMIVLVSTLCYYALSAKDMENTGVNYAEYFALIFFITSGIAMVSSFQSLLILFLGIEIISIPLYILTGADKKNLKSNEASLKYFLLGTFSTCLMLMGIALVYGAAGSFSSDAIATAIKSGDAHALMVAGMLLLMFSMAFKVSAAPFHFWTPDVYDGAPTVFTSFMATIVKVAVFIAFIRLFDDVFGNLRGDWKLFVIIVTVATLFIGNITAVFQQSVKRMLAYSSIAQAGFMMLAIFSMNTEAKEGLLLYAAAYSIATIGIFAVLIKMSDHSFDGFNGFAKREPLLAATTTVFLLSLAGIPLTGGFIAKFYMLRAAMGAGNSLWLVIFAVIMAAVSVYYYFRVIQAMYFREGQGTKTAPFTPAFKWISIALVLITLLIGIFPNLILNWLYF